MTSGSIPPLPLGRRRGAALTLIVWTLTAVAAVAGVVYVVSRSGGEAESIDQVEHTIARGEFIHRVVVPGEIESSENSEVRCEVKARNSSGTSILWVEKEGKRVKKGDLLVTLDSSAWEDEKTQQEIFVLNKETEMVQAENTFRAAEIAKKEYVEGTFKQTEQEILGEIFVARENLRRAQQYAQYSERLAAKGYVTALQLEGDRFAVEKAQNDMNAAQTKLDVLRRYTKAKMVKQLDSDINSAKKQWDSARQAHLIELNKLADIKEQIEKCKITASQDGQVVYANVTSRRGNSEFVVEPGAFVRERQTIIRLPDMHNMQVDVKIKEAQVALVKKNMGAIVRIDSLKNLELDGRVSHVNAYPEGTSFYDRYNKEYAATIKILDPPAVIRPGLTAKVDILIERIPDVVQAPVQAVLRRRDSHFCYVKRDNEWSRQPVEIGPNNAKFVVIKRGLSVGDIVAMNPRALAEADPNDKLTEFASVGSERKTPTSDKGVTNNKSEKGGAATESNSSGRGGASPNRQGSAGGRPGGSQASGFDPQAIFARLDQNSDGKIDSGELAAMPDRFRDRLKAADTDSNGAISRAEWAVAAAAMRARMSGDQPAGRPAGGRP